jgi:hypothetical protein
VKCHSGTASGTGVSWSETTKNDSFVWRGRLKLELDFSNLIKKKMEVLLQTPDYGIITQRAKRLWLFWVANLPKRSNTKLIEMLDRQN